MIQEKTLELAANLNFSELKASNDWVEAFRKKYGIKFFND